MKNWSKEEVSNLYVEYGIPESAGQINYAVNGYKVLYFTPEYNGEIVMCSGAIFLPENINCSPPLLSWQHGTESNDEAIEDDAVLIEEDNDVDPTAGVDITPTEEKEEF